MKAILEFDLNDIDDRLNHLRAIKADNAYSSLYEITVFLRQQNKILENSDASDEVFDLLNHITSYVKDILSDNGIDLDTEYS